MVQLTWSAGDTTIMTRQDSHCGTETEKASQRVTTWNQSCSPLTELAVKLARFSIQGAELTKAVLPAKIRKNMTAHEHLP